MSDAEKDALVNWFHREFGAERCAHPLNSRAQCEAWADQFIRTGPRDLPPETQADS